MGSSLHHQLVLSYFQGSAGKQMAKMMLLPGAKPDNIVLSIKSRFGIPDDQRLLLRDAHGHYVPIDSTLTSGPYDVHARPVAVVSAGTGIEWMEMTDEEEATSSAAPAPAVPTPPVEVQALEQLPVISLEGLEPHVAALVQTERDYVMMLRTSLHFLAGVKGLTSAASERIKTIVETLAPVSACNEGFLAELHSAVQSGAIGEEVLSALFSKWLPAFDVYLAYAGQKQFTNERLQEVMKDVVFFQALTEYNQTATVDLPGSVNRPFDRVGKYKALLTLLKATGLQQVVAQLAGVARAMMRNGTQAELLFTERAYLKQLQHVRELYYDKLVRGTAEVKKHLGITSVTLDQAQGMLGQVVSLQTLTETFCADLQKEISRGGDLGKLFLKMKNYFAMYKAYAANKSRSEQILNELLDPGYHHRDFQRYELQASQACGHRLASLLITPIQRVPRYEMLLGAIIKFTPEDDPCYENLVLAKAAMHEIAHSINERVRESEGREKVFKLSKELKLDSLVTAARMYIQDGVLKEISKKKPASATTVYLFNDLIMGIMGGGSVGKSEQTFSYDINKAGGLSVKVVEPSNVDYSRMYQKKSKRMSERKTKTWGESFAKGFGVFAQTPQKKPAKIYENSIREGFLWVLVNNLGHPQNVKQDAEEGVVEVPADERWEQRYFVLSAETETVRIFKTSEEKSHQLDMQLGNGAEITTYGDETVTFRLPFCFSVAVPVGDQQVRYVFSGGAGDDGSDDRAEWMADLNLLDPEKILTCAIRAKKNCGKRHYLFKIIKQGKTKSAVTFLEAATEDLMLHWIAKIEAQAKPK